MFVAHVFRNIVRLSIRALLLSVVQIIPEKIIGVIANHLNDVQNIRNRQAFLDKPGSFDRHPHIHFEAGLQYPVNP